MTSTRKAFLIYYDNKILINRLSDEDAGKLLKSLFVYGEDHIKPDFDDNPALAMVFDMLSLAIDRNAD